MRLICGVLFVVAASFTQAHELKGELQVDNVIDDTSGKWIDVLINNTNKDQKITCAVYDANKKLLGTSGSRGRPLATAVGIRALTYDAKDVRYARCVAE